MTAELTPDGFDSPDGRTYSAPEGQAAMPGRETLEHLAAGWEAVARRNRVNGQIAIDKGDESGSEGFVYATTFEHCAAELRATAEAIAAAAPAPQAEGGARKAPASLALPGDVSADNYAITAFGAYNGFEDGQQAVAAFRMLTEGERENWRAAADGVRVLGDLFAGREPEAIAADVARRWEPQPQPAPELGAADVSSAMAATASRELAEAMRESRRYREGIEHEVRQLETSARISDPSKKSEIEKALAGRLRKILEGK